MLCIVGTAELILISGVILLIFGGKKLPELMKGMGKGVKSFKEGMVEPSEDEMNRRVEEEIQRRADAMIELKTNQQVSPDQNNE